MGLFKSKEKKEAEKNKARKIAAIKELEAISDDAYSKRVIDAKVQLELVKNKLDEPSLTLNSEQLDVIEECLKSIKTHMDKSYGSYIVSKCRKIDDILKGKVVAITEEGKVMEDNEENIAEIEAKINDYYNQIAVKIDEVTKYSSEIDNIKAAQNQCLEDKTQWKKYYYNLKKVTSKLQRANGNLQNLERQIQIEAQSLDMFIKANQNIATAESIKRAAQLANKIEKQKNIVDTDVAEMYAKYSHEQYENIKDTSNKLDNLANMYFPGNGDEAGDYEAEFAYQRACEAKAVDVMNGVNQSTGSPTSKTK